MYPCFKRFRKVVFLLILVAIVPPVRAQTPQASSSLKFSCVIWNNLSYPTILYRQQNTYLPITLYPQNRSMQYPLAGEKNLNLYIPQVQPDGKPGYRLMGTAPVIPGVKRMLFIIEEKNDASGLPLSLFGLDDSLDTFPAGAFRFFNFTDLPLQISFGGTTTALVPKAITVVPSEVSPSGGFVPLVIQNKAGKIVFQTRAFGEPTGREMVFVEPPTGPMGAYSVKFITELLPQKLPPIPTAASGP